MTFRLFAMIALSVMFALVKWASERGVHIVETVFYRQLFALPVALVWMIIGPGLSSLKTQRLGVHASRTLVGTFGMCLNFLSVMLLPLAEATAFGFSVPIFATILSAIFLHEKVGRHRWAAVILGFIGVLIIAQPSADMNISHLGMVVAIAAALNTSFVSILLRQLGRTEAPTTTVFYFSALSLPLLAMLMPFFANAHDRETWIILIIMGVSGGIGQMLMTSALRWGPISLVLPMDYSTLIWSTLIGWVIWHNWPGPGTWAGAALIIGSGLYIALRERKVKGASEVTISQPD
jgi:drug/metabolite transporter (DMT)-like permease